MWTKENSIANFKNAMNALVESKYILADQKVGDVLKAIAGSRMLYELFEHVTEGFDYVTFKSVCLIEGEDGKGRFSMPKRDEDVLAFVFLLLMEIDSRREDILRLILGYFYTSENKQLSYNSFAMQVLIPFGLLTERTAYKMMSCGSGRDDEDGTEERAAADAPAKEREKETERKPVHAGKRRGLEKLEYVLNRDGEKLAKAKVRGELKEEIDFAKDMILRFYAERDDEGTACAFLAYRCLAEKAKKANLAIEELTEILGGDHGENG